jgi:hypothetical protein
MEARSAGVADRALITAGYINFGFNTINRVAGGLGVRLPDAADLNAAARVLLTVGYRPLSGWPFGSACVDPEAVDPFAPLVEVLRAAALHGRAALSTNVRAALYEGNALGQLGEFERLVGERAETIAVADVDALRREAFSEDDIFEATICAALGAATRRLDRLLSTAFSFGTATWGARSGLADPRAPSGWPPTAPVL